MITEGINLPSSSFSALKVLSNCLDVFNNMDNTSDIVSKTLIPTPSLIRRMLEPLKFFGEKFRDKIFDEINGDPNKEQQLKAFQEIFAIRNLIAHQTFIGFTSNKIRGKSFLDIKQMHEDAIKFVEYLKEKFI